MSSPVSSEKKKRVPGTPKTPQDEDSQLKSRRKSVPRDMQQDEPAKKSPSDFKTLDRSRQNTPATDNSPLDSKRSGSFTPKTPVASLRDHGPLTRRQSICEKELPRKALFPGPEAESPCESSSKYKTPDLSHQKMSRGPMTIPATEYRPLDSTSDGKAIKAPSTHPQEAPRKSHRSRSRLLNNPEADMVMQPRSLFQEPALPESPCESSNSNRARSIHQRELHKGGEF
ncbi:uncharacterized protein LOC132171515 isoform X2 [Corylus avellana]|uniref:uncharacterized protein LOC132171515 isoform X2 n=1 Tax=Corylus avellana TaxID=13451 RepID=UPI00286A30C0|nr:uncharacterized protein LOC132171515 isoform X2 [Corylus avellana]